MPSSEERRKEYWARVNRAVDYIEGHLGDDLSLQDIAAAAYFSPYHFHRIFKSFMGEPVSQFVQRVRLEKAAALLSGNQEKTVTRIAMECGYANPAAFSRAFKGTFGRSPSQWRKEESKNCIVNGKGGKEPSYATAYSSGVASMSSESNTRRQEMAEKLKMEVRVGDLPETTVAYIRHVGPYKGDPELFEGLFSRLFTWAGPRNLMQFPETQVLAIYHDDPGVTEEEKLRLSVGISVPPDTAVSGEVGKLTLSAGTYAQAKFELDPEEYQAAWEMVYGQWLPESGYQPEDGLPFERYLNDPKEHPEGKCIAEICLPVKPL